MTNPSEVTAPDLTFSSGAPTAQGMTTLLTGAAVSGGFSPLWIALPGVGQLEVIYEYQDQPAATAMLWHQGGRFENLKPGPNLLISLAGDALYFALAYEGQSIKVGWAYL